MPSPRHSVSVAGAVIDKQGRVLAIRRRDNGHWEPPGGVLELHETIEDGLVREIKEETGLTVVPDRLTGVYKNTERGIVALVFRCSLTDGAITRTDNEAAEIAWLTADEIEQRMDEAYAVRLLDALIEEAPAIRAHDGVNLQRGLAKWPAYAGELPDRHTLLEGGTMSTEESSEKSRLVKMTASTTLQGTADGVQINAELSPAPPADQRWWWLQQVSDRMRIVGTSGGPNRFAVVVQVPRGDLELAARQLREALADAVAAYPTSYPSARRASDEQVAVDERARRQQQALDQEIVDRVMGEALGTVS